MGEETKIIGGAFGYTDIVIDDKFKTVPNKRDREMIKKNLKRIKSLKDKKTR